MNLESLLNQLTVDLELSPIPPKDENRGYLLPLTAELKISVKEMDPGCLFQTILGACPTLKKEELFIWLMKANLLGQGTGGGVLGLDIDEKFVLFSLFLPIDMNYKSFKESLEDFTNYSDYWKEELLNHQKNAESLLMD